MILESDKKPLLYGVLTTLAFLSTAAILHFSSSKQSIQAASLIFATLSVFAGLTAGLITHCCAEQKTSRNLCL